MRVARIQPSHFAALVALVAIAACGPKRPPVVATQGGTESAPASPDRSGESAETLEPGPDVQPIEGEGLGQDVIDMDSASGEGGPLGDIFFGYDQAALTDEARATLEKHALWLQNQRDARLRVEGHCDERGTVDYNLALGDQRAQAARDYLLSLGVSPERLTTVSYGKERPLDPGHDESAWARNRRVHFAVHR
jgi:peptidoglycan-associated lipoprotein